VTGPELLRAGDAVDGWRVVDVPGHSDGHVALLRDGVLVVGDHLLPTISPAVGLFPSGRLDPLGVFLDSLRYVIELAPRLALPGHGDPIDDPAGRARELLEHHRERLDVLAAALTPEPLHAYALSQALFASELPPLQRRFAVAETLAHLERLVREDRARRREDGGTVTYTAP
jgi:glyoxylase-like metal-dependent hydrolase (beta-lactamase superfamily II)